MAPNRLLMVILFVVTCEAASLDQQDDFNKNVEALRGKSIENRDLTDDGEDILSLIRMFFELLLRNKDKSLPDPSEDSTSLKQEPGQNDVDVNDVKRSDTLGPLVEELTRKLKILQQKENALVNENDQQVIQDRSLEEEIAGDNQQDVQAPSSQMKNLQQDETSLIEAKDLGEESAQNDDQSVNTERSETLARLLKSLSSQLRALEQDGRALEDEKDKDLVQAETLQQEVSLKNDKEYSPVEEKSLEEEIDQTNQADVKMGKPEMLETLNKNRKELSNENVEHVIQDKSLGEESSENSLQDVSVQSSKDLVRLLKSFISQLKTLNQEEVSLKNDKEYSPVEEKSLEEDIDQTNQADVKMGKKEMLETLNKNRKELSNENVDHVIQDKSLEEESSENSLQDVNVEVSKDLDLDLILKSLSSQLRDLQQDKAATEGNKDNPNKETKSLEDMAYTDDGEVQSEVRSSFLKSLTARMDAIQREAQQ